ncbi:Asp23/Gls24 family envelope stress response protein [Anaerobacillus alkaliphilus]|uniref:Asp23/Gls24 family envelope stress response protein n=1 Tax=Anaerobacillus alkaliphilus TaxID=1548597 RepID=A0A4Q0VPH6_9BACI|nr:Asp23/Gls24 family envelope stress response protein [Anaerobacillus alkaliphilus]RXI98138.1 Asp23/Gls24 family envelope stress response protein [Anaerobacillus alkaliphilus]
MLKKRLEKGELSIFDDVVKVITEMAISEINGVEVSTSFFQQKILEKVNRNNRNIFINSSNDGITISLKVGVRYGLELSVVLSELQQVVKNHVELYTNFSVKEVNVLVDQIIVNE